MQTKGTDKNEQSVRLSYKWETALKKHYFQHFYDEAMRQLDQPFQNISPYWLELPIMQECNIGNALGKVIDDEEKFAVEIDVSQFKPQELSVNVRENELIIEAHQQPRPDEIGTIERHFIRRYFLPQETKSDCVISRLSNTGVLTVSAPKCNHTRSSHSLSPQTLFREEANEKPAEVHSLGYS